MKELTIRTLSGIFFVFIIISSLLAHELSFMILFLVVLIFSLNEFYNFFFKLKFLPYKPAGIITGALLYLLNYLIASGTMDKSLMVLNILLVFVFSAFPLFYSPKTFSKSWVSTISGWIYIVLPLSLLPFIVFRTGDYHPEILLGVFILIWIYDSFAYLIGTWIGKHRIFPSISPKKSWEGFAGGLILTMGASFLLQLLPENVYDSFNWARLSIIVVLTGTTGDFFESALKRNAGVKDSGLLMPGHGGFLDRFDSFLFCIPFVFMYLQLFLEI